MVYEVKGLNYIRKSRKTILITLCISSIDLCHLCIKLSKAFIVDDRGKPPYWESEIFPSVSSYIHRTAKDSWTFARTLVRAIGHRSSASVHGTDFGMPDTLYFFQIWGKIFDWKDSVKISVKDIAKYFAKVFTIFINGSYAPGALLLLIFTQFVLHLINSD
jgi:hypothetical protein